MTVSQGSVGAVGKGVPQLEYKISGAEFKVSDQDGKADYEGFFSIFNNMDDGGDVIMRGAFNKTIKEMGHRVKMLYQHNPMAIIGPKPDILEEQEKGLFAKGRIIKETFWGKEAFILMKEGAVTEGSIGYLPVHDKTEWRDDGARILKEVKLFEVSPVPWGMNPLTEVNAVKAMWGRVLPGVSPEVAEARKVDEYLVALGEITRELKEGRVLSAASKQKVGAAKEAMAAAIEALDTLMQAAEPDDEKANHSALDKAKEIAERLGRLEQFLGACAQVGV